MDELKIWNDGKYLYDGTALNLLDLKAGQLLGKTLSKTTICPKNNRNCAAGFEISVVGYNPFLEQKYESKFVVICPYAVTKIDDCPLAKGD